MNLSQSGFPTNVIKWLKFMCGRFFQEEEKNEDENTFGGCRKFSTYNENQFLCFYGTRFGI
jgi:hypothetical protein